MKISNKLEFQQITVNHSSVNHTDIKYFIRLYKECTTKQYCFLVNDTTLILDNIFTFVQNIIMKVDEKIRDKKLPCNINKEVGL